MFKKLIYLISFVSVLGLANNASADLIGHWGFDEDSGNVASDTSGGDNHGILRGDPQWVEGLMGGALAFDGDGDKVEVENVVSGDATFMFWMKTAGSDETTMALIHSNHPNWGDWAPIFIAATHNTKASHFYGGAMFSQGAANEDNAAANASATDVVTDQWVHIAVVRDTTTQMRSLYINGQLENSFEQLNSAPLDNNPTIVFGGLIQEANPYTGLLDDIRIYDHVASPEEILAVASEPEMAQTPSPDDGDINVVADVVLSWTPGLGADTHDVYFGADPDALGLVGPGQTATTYDPDGLLDWGQTYYWRIDEVQAGGTIITGNVLSFTVEPIGLPVENVTTTASSTNSASEGPENTINGSGLGADDLHAAENDTMWLSNFFDSGPVWIQYDFDRLYKLNDMSVWNHNSLSESSIGYGIKEATVEYSADGTTWSVLDAQEFVQAPGEDGYAANTTVDLGVAAQSVRITANSNWGEGLLPQFGLSEVAFTNLPVRAGNPQPESGATDVGPDVILGWSAGREAVEHDLYLSTDEQAVRDGTADMIPLVDSSHSTSLDLASEYFWRVDEINNDEIWVGDVWSLTTPEFLVVEDFESYNNDSENYNRIFQVWIDGAGYAEPAPGDPGNGSGSLVGASEAPWVEQTIVYDGMQSMPMFYNNDIAMNSEATRTFSPAQDWTGNGIKALTVMFYGDAANTAQQMYVKINGAKVPYDGDADDLKKPRWQRWYIDLTSLSVSNVTELTIGFERMGASAGQGTVLFDAIRLDSRDAASITPSYVNILANGGFEDGVLEPWNFPNVTAEVVQDLTGATVPEAPIEGDSALHITIAKTDEIGAGFWLYNARQQPPGFVFEAGKKYTLSVFLKAKAGTEMDANLRPTQADGSWPNFNEKFVDITDTWAEYSTTTEVFSVDTAPGMIIIQLGFVSGEVWMDDVRLYEGDYVPSE